MSVEGRLSGKSAIVAGAGQTPGETIGNGRATALLFARAGAQVLCLDRQLERAQETVAQIAQHGGTAEAVEADIADPEACERIAALAVDRWGAPDILINNVGIGGGDGPAHKLDEEAFDRTLKVNLKGMWLLCRAVLPAMREARAGAIVNISSLASIAGGFQLAYELSKAGVNRLTTSIAQSNASRGVRCNAILPGLMDTPMAIEGISQAMGISADELRADRNARVPLAKQMGTGWDTAHAALFLASDEAKFITGVLLPVDGGASVRIA